MWKAFCSSTGSGDLLLRNSVTWLDLQINPSGWFLPRKRNNVGNSQHKAIFYCCVTNHPKNDLKQKLLLWLIVFWAPWVVHWAGTRGKQGKCLWGTTFKEVPTRRGVQLSTLYLHHPETECLLKICALGTLLASPQCLTLMIPLI